MPISPARARAPLPVRLGRLARHAGVLAEAFVALAVASAAIRCLPFARVMRAAAWRGKRRSPHPGAARRVRWAVDRWADVVPWRAVCFQRGLAAHWMLRRRGVASFLHYGIDGRGPAGISAHVWVEVDGTPLIGGEDRPRHARVLVRPDPAQPAAAAGV